MNIAVAGASGQGKSSLIRALLGLGPTDHTGPEVGASGEVTRVMQPYSSEQFPGTYLWDMPGACTPNHPSETYLMDVGLKHFSGVIIVSQDRFTEVDGDLREAAEFHGILYQYVQSKIDVALESAENDHGKPYEETLGELQKGLVQAGVPEERIHLITTRAHFREQGIGKLMGLEKWIDEMSRNLQQRSRL